MNNTAADNNRLNGHCGIITTILVPQFDYNWTHALWAKHGGDWDKYGVFTQINSVPPQLQQVIKEGDVE